MRKMLFLGALALMPALATAQSSESSSSESGGRKLRFVLGLEGGYRAVSAFDATDRDEWSVNTGTAYESVAYKGYKGASVGLSAAVWPTKRFGVGFSFVSSSGQSNATVTGFRPNRTGPGVTAVEDFKYDGSQIAINAQLHLAIVAGDKTSWSVFGGPSWYKADQTVVSTPGSVGYGTGYRSCVIVWPYLICYTTITNYTRVEIDKTELETSNQNGSAIGFNIGTELTHYFAPKVGVAVGARYSTASIPIKGIETSTDKFNEIKLKAGGFEAYGGIRLRF